MQHRLARAGLITFVLLVTTFGAILLPGAANSASIDEPQQLYNRTWQLVRDNYYDPTFNKQNWESWHHKFDGKLTSNELACEAIKTMLNSLNDQYTRFLEPKAFKEEDDAINSVVCGIGISLRPYIQTHALIVNDVIEGGPAARGGITYGDEIMAIDGLTSGGINTEKAAERIRGKAGTTLSLRIKHRNGKTADIKITREQVCIPAVSHKMMDNNVGYIKLATFMADDASIEFRNALQNLSNASGLIIDLRDNPGGLLANAIEISDMLMPSGKIVTTVSRRGIITDACSGRSVTRQPIVLLVDEDSASASEILAGALKDNSRAALVGSKTFGKGLVQEINRLPGGAGLHITVARYYTPNGNDINKVGIKPDFEQSDRDKQLATALSVLQMQISESHQRYDARLGLLGTPKRSDHDLPATDNEPVKLSSPRT